MCYRTTMHQVVSVRLRKKKNYILNISFNRFFPKHFKNSIGDVYGDYNIIKSDRQNKIEGEGGVVLKKEKKGIVS